MRAGLIEGSPRAIVYFCIDDHRLARRNRARRVLRTLVFFRFSKPKSRGEKLQNKI
jgi:hypothetical protein